jgi:RNA-directed DNA polymerase
MASVVRFIERRLRLEVNQAESAVARPEERHFVGFSLRRTSEDGSVEVFLSKRSKVRIDARIRELTPRAWGRSLKGCIATLNTYLRGWLNFFGTSCTKTVVRALHNLDAHIRRRLRALLLRQWKRRRFIVHK